jgi:hypothetical protein
MSEKKTITGKDVAEWEELFKQGWSYSQIARKYDRVPQVVRHHLMKRGHKAHEEKTSVVPDEESKWITRFLAGEDPENLAPQRTSLTVYRHLAFRLRDMVQGNKGAPAPVAPKKEVPEPPKEVTMFTKIYRASKKLCDELRWIYTTLPEAPDFIPVTEISDRLKDLEREIELNAIALGLPFKSALREGCVAAAYEQAFDIQQQHEEHDV